MVQIRTEDLQRTRLEDHVSVEKAEKRTLDRQNSKLTVCEPCYQQEKSKKKNVQRIFLYKPNCFTVLKKY